MATSRTATTVWTTTYDKLKELSETTKKPMTQLIDEAVDLLVEHYSQASHKESL